MLYRILTERKNQQGIESLASKYFDGFTVYPAIGFWQGRKEGSIILEVETNLGNQPINQLALDIKALNQQQAILVQRIANSSWLI